MNLQGRKKSFTLLELIIVIIIIGILAGLGFSQYGKAIETSRLAEAKAAFGYMRERASEFYLKNGSFSSITAADLGIGSDLPASCVSTHYFSYQTDNHTAVKVQLNATRCKSGGKAPNYPASGITWELFSDCFADGHIDSFRCWDNDASAVVSCPP